MSKQSLNKILDDIDNFLAKGDEYSRDLWKIITAQRGPDNNDKELKNATTVHIRKNTFPKTAKLIKDKKITVEADFQTSKGFRYNSDPSNHFDYHVGAAYKVLVINKRWRKGKK